jgi:serine protease Do
MHLCYKNRMQMSFTRALAFTCVVGAGGAHANNTPLFTEASPTRRALMAIPSLAPLVDATEPAVLVIFTEAAFADVARDELPPGHPPLGGPGLPPGHPPIPGGDAPDMPENIEGQGAGFIISKDGYALTNHHVIEHAISIRVRVGDNLEEIPAIVVGSDEKTDVALIKLQSPKTDWQTLPLADSDKLRVGDVVVAIGSPFGLAQSVSTGILSARGRREIAPSGRQGLYDFLQTDASINPGNSGGPLIDITGAVVGINSAVNVEGNGIGFAIPINQVKRMVAQLRDKGYFERSWLGVGIFSVDPDVAPALGLKTAAGALVREVVAGGPADKAGVLPGDVITTFNGTNVFDSSDLPFIAGDTGVNKTVPVGIVRDGASKTVSLTLEPHPDNRAAIAAGVKREDDKKTTVKPAKPPSLGLFFVSLNDTERARLALPRTMTGAQVTRVKPGSAAFNAGLVEGDVITSLNGAAVANADALTKTVQTLPAQAIMKMIIRRKDASVFVILKKP